MAWDGERPHSRLRGGLRRRKVRQEMLLSSTDDVSRRPFRVSPRGYTVAKFRLHFPRSQGNVAA